MNNNIDLDEYSKWLPLLGTPEMENAHLPIQFVERLQRVKGIYDYWLRFPNKNMNDIVLYEEQMFGIKRTQAYLDIRLVKLLLGDIEASTKQFWRWRINTLIMDSITLARREKDFKSVSSLIKNLILNNKTDKEDPAELGFEQIVPSDFEMSDDIAIVIPGKQKTSRAKIIEKLKKYGKKDVTDIQDADFEELDENGTKD